MMTELNKAPWWRKTNKLVQEKVSYICGNSSLVNNFFLNLSNEDAEYRLVEIQDIISSDETAIVKIQVESKLNNQKLNKEFSLFLKESTIRGRCLIVIKTNSKENYIVLNKVKKIWSNKTILCGFNSFLPSFAKPTLSELPSKIKHDLDILCEGGEWTISQIMDLGSVNIDSENSGNQIPLFILELSTNTVNLKKADDTNLVVFKEGEEMEIIKKTTDAVTLSLLSKKLLI